MEKEFQENINKGTYSSIKLFLLSISYIFLLILIAVVAKFASRQKIDTLSRAASSSVEIALDHNKSYGTIDQDFGVAIPKSLDDGVTQSLINYFDGDGIYLKVADPDQNLINNANFAALSSRNFRWYFTFSQKESIKAFLNSYFGKYNASAIVEICDVDADFIKDLRNYFSNIKVHVGCLPNWPRDKANQILQKLAPPAIEAVSFRAEVNYFPEVFSQIKDIYDTIFDAALNIPGLSGVVINYPSGIKLSLSGIDLSNIKPDNILTYTSGVVVSSLINSVQYQKSSKNIPLSYIIAGDFSQKSEAEKKLLGYFSDFARAKPVLYWPRAGGSCWEEKNPTLPVIGLMGKKNSLYNIFLINTSAQEIIVNFSQELDLNTYYYYSTLRGNGNFTVSGKGIKMLAKETIFASQTVENRPPTKAPFLPSSTPSTNQPTQSGAASVPTSSAPNTYPTRFSGNPPVISRPPPTIFSGRAPFASPGQIKPSPTKAPNQIGQVVKNTGIFFNNLYQYLVKLSQTILP